MSYVENDPNTNLPKLPDGYFFRVRRNTNMFSRSELSVQLRKKYWIGSGEVFETWVYDDYTPRAIWHVALRLLKRFEEAAASRKVVDSLVGDYPPKKLDI